MKAAGVSFLLTMVLSSLAGCSPVDVSGHVRHRTTVGDHSAGGPAGSSVAAIGYAAREWNDNEPIPAGKGRVVLLRPRSPDDPGDGLIFRINDRGDFLLGAGCALAWNHPAGTLKILFVYRFTVAAGEQRLRDRDPVMSKLPEGNTSYFLVSGSRRGTPLLSPIEGRDAERILADRALKKSALHRDAEEGIPWLP